VSFENTVATDDKNLFMLPVKCDEFVLVVKEAEVRLRSQFMRRTLS
jgi:hypothetical protein